jgi:hypothetical protein
MLGVLRSSPTRRLLLFWPVCMGAVIAGCGSSDGVDPDTTPTLSSLEITPARRVARVGDKFPLGLEARDLAGAAVTAASARWSSSSNAVAAVRSGGEVTAAGPGTAVITVEAGGRQATATLYVGPATFDLVAGSLPRFVTADHHDLANIYRISRFRSGIGHSNGPETIEPCRNLKHYYQPLTALDWTKAPIYSPVDGTVLSTQTDGLYGVRVYILPRDFTPAWIVLHHVAADPALVAGTWLVAGQRIGSHSSQQTYSDVSVFVATPTLGDRPVSLFEVMSDAVFAHYQALGVASREALIITKAERDADPISCVPDLPFPTPGHIENWVYLH